MPIAFDGATYTAVKDGPRLTGQLERVRNHMEDGQWHTLAILADWVGGSEAGVSARLRDLRKPRFGGYVVTRRRCPGVSGLWEYRMEGAA